MLVDPATYRAALPALRRFDPVPAKQDPAVPAALLLAWEIEIPLWNLAGRLWLRPRPDGVDLDLSVGDFAPGRFALRVRPDGDTCLVTVEGRANVRDANWLTKRLVARSPLAEPAMTAAGVWVLLRAMVLEAGRVAGKADARRLPQGQMSAPSRWDLDGRPLAALATQRPLREAFPVLAVVRSRPDGRLDRVDLAITTRVPVAALAPRLSDAGAWRALPGWKKLTVTPSRAPTASPDALWEVDSTFPFVDFDATWTVAPGPPWRASIERGDWEGAVMGWDLVPATDGKTGTAVFSMHPRIDRTGYVPRKFIATEPLLEHGLALGLAYVDAESLLRALGN